MSRQFLPFVYNEGSFTYVTLEIYYPPHSFHDCPFEFRVRNRDMQTLQIKTGSRWQCYDEEKHGELDPGIWHCLYHAIEEEDSDEEMGSVL